MFNVKNKGVVNVHMTGTHALVSNLAMIENTMDKLKLARDSRVALLYTPREYATMLHALSNAQREVVNILSQREGIRD